MSALRLSKDKARKWPIKGTLGVVVLLAAGLLAAGAFGGVSPLGFTSSGGTSASSAAPVATSRTAASNYLVTFSHGTTSSTQAAAIAAAGATVISSIAPLSMDTIKVPAGSKRDVLAALRANANVAGIALNMNRQSEGSVDPAYPDQWNLPQVGWDQVYGSSNPHGSSTIAVLDTGVSGSTGDLNLGAGWSAFGTDPASDPNGHGTAVASIAAATAGNGIGVAGVDFANVTILPVQVLNSNGLGLDSDIVQGVVWAADHGANVISMSFSNPGYSQALQDAINYAWSKGVVVVAATGNGGSSSPTYPAGDADVMGVAGTDQSDQPWSSSNTGQDTFIAAPATNIPADATDGGETSITGTSASAAEIAGAAALLMANDPSATNAIVDGRLAESADAVGTSDLTGNGRLNVARAFADTSTHGVTPVGAPGGGPIVGPYGSAPATCVWTGATSTAWNVTTNWSACGTGTGTPAGTPGAGDTANIPGGLTTYPNITTSITTGTVVVNNTGTGATLTVSASGSFSMAKLTVNANGTFAESGGAVTFSAANDTTINGTLNISGGTYTIPSNKGITGTGALQQSAGTLTVGTAGTGGADFHLSGTVALSGGVLQIGHDFQPTAANLTATGGTVEFLGAAGAGINAGGTYNFYNLQIDNGADPNLKGASGVVIKVAGTWTFVGTPKNTFGILAGATWTAGALVEGGVPQAAGSYGNGCSSCTAQATYFPTSSTGKLNVAAGGADATHSTLTPTSSGITANGTATQVLTVQAKDASGNNLTIGGSTVTITQQSGTGTIGSVTDNGNGTYTATVTAPTATGSGVFVATLGGNPVKSGTGSQTLATVTYTPGAADATQSTLTPTSSSITANGVATQVLTVQAKDANGNNETAGGSTVTITKSSGAGSIGSVTDNGNGTYTATVTAPASTGSGIFVATLGANPVKSGTGSQTQATVNYVPGAADATQSTLTPTSSSITANGTATQVLTVQAKDANGNNETSGGSTVTITKQSGSGSIGSVTDNGNGTYTATVTAPTATGSGIFVATLGGNPVKSGTGSQTQATVTYTPGAADATQSTLTPTSSSITANGTATQVLTVQAKDANGNNETSGGSTVTITKQSGTGSISSVTDNGNGTYTATVTAPTATGSGVFIATLGGNPVKSGSGSQTQATVNYVPGAAAKLAFSQSPSSGSADNNLSPQPQVTVQDAFGNTVTSDSSTVTLTATIGPGSLTGCSTQAASSGVATFSGCAIHTTGTGYKLHATDGSLTVADSSAFDITPGAAAKLSFSQSPSSGSADNNLSPQPQVTVQDQYGNTVTSDGSTVTLTAFGPGFLTGCSTQAASSGVATFSGCAIRTVGTYTLHASDGSLTATDSSAFNITVGAAAQLAFSASPGTTSADNNLSPQPKVTVQDQYGNTVTTDTSTVTLSIKSGTPTSGGPGSLTGCSTQAASSGVATFSGCAIHTVGTGYKLHAIDGSLTAADSGVFTITAGASAKLAVTQSPSSGSADNNLSPQPKVTVEDQYGNLVGGDSSTVTLTATIGPGSLTGCSTQAASIGVATFSGCAIRTVGTGYKLHATDGSLTPADSSAFNITPGAANATQSTLTPVSSSITANGTATQVLTVQAEDQFGNNETSGGSTVAITNQSGTGSIGSVTDNSNGTYTATVTAPTATGSGVFVATLGGNPVKSGSGSQTQATVTYTPGAADATQSTLTPTSSSITANGTATQVLTVQAKDANGNNETSGGSTVTITKSSGAGSIGSVNDNGNGTYTATVTAPTATGSGVFVATLGGSQVKSGGGSQTQATVTYTPGAADASQSTLTPVSSSITANGTATQVLTVQAKDVFGNNETSGGSTVTITKLSGSGTIGSVSDNGNGTYTATVTAPTATGSGVFVSTLGGNPVKSGTGSQTQATVNYVPGPADATQSTLTPTSSSITANGSATQVLTVQAKDANGNNLTSGGSTVTITKQSGSGTIGSVSDNGNGTYTATVTAPTATGSGVFVATLGGNPVKSGTGSQTQATVTYTPGAADATQSTLTPTSSSITANGSATQVLTVQAKDANGNNETSGGSTVTITKQSGSGSIGSVSDNGDGTYTATVTAPTATGSGVFVATLGGNPVKSGTGSQTQATVTYTPGAADATQSTLAPTSSSITADGTSTKVLTVQAKDAFGNNETTGGSTVTITKLSGSGSIGSVTDNGNGTYTATVTAPTATGSGVFVATLGGQPVKSGTGSQTQATVTYTPGAADATQSTLTPTSSSITANGSATQVLTVQAKDAFGNNETTGGSTVTITKLSGSGSIGSVSDNGNGTYTATVTAPTATGSGVFVASLGGSPVKSGTGSQTQATVTYTPGAADATQSTLTPTSSSITADGTSTKVLTVQAKDANGNNETSGGSTVTITKQSGSGSIGSVSDNGNGTYTATVTAPTATGSGVFVATLGGNPVKSGTGSQTQATVTYTPGAADATQSTLTPTSSSITANGSATQVLTVQAKDANGNNETSGGSTVTITKLSGSGSIGSVTDNGNGTYTATVTAPTATGSGVFVATLGGNPVKSGAGSQTQATVTYTPGAADATQSTLAPTSSSITADGTSTKVLTVQAKDANGNNETSGGSTVTITKLSGSGSIGSVSDNGNGTYTATVTAPTATGSGVFVASLGGSPVKSGTGSQTQATVTYTPGAADATQSTLTPTSSSITADGTSTKVLTVQAKDANGNNETSGGSTVTITKQSGSGSIGSVTDNGNGTYTATVTAPTATGSGVFVATLGGNPVKSGTGSQTQATVNYVPGAGAGSQSSISASPHTINADGSSTSTVTVTVYDAYGNLTSGGDAVVLHTDLGSLGSVTDNSDGTYTAILTAGTTAGTAHITGTVNSGTIATTDAVVFKGIFTKYSDVMINGQPTVGTALTITNGVYSPTVTSRSDLWQLCDSTGASCLNISGATSNTYTPAPGDVGHTLRVVETVSRAGYNDGGSTSVASPVVIKGSFTTSTAVAINGTPTVDTATTLTAGSYSPTPSSVSYQWRLCDSAGASCSNIGGANTSSYTPVAGDAGSTLRVVETVSRNGYNDGGSTSASATVVLGPITTNTAVAINGTPTVAASSTITAGTYTPSSTGSSYQWERCDSGGASCSNIGGATSTTYTPVAGDVGSTLRVVETVTKSGYADGGSTSAASPLVVKASFSTTTAVSLSGGTPTVATATTLTAGSYSPSPTSSSYQWELCDSSGGSCSNIGGATSSAYTPVAGDVGSTLRVVETVSKSGYNDGGSTSNASALVIKNSFTMTTAVAINGTPTVGTATTLTAGSYSPSPMSSSYQWELCDSSGGSCSNIGGAMSNTYTPVSGQVGSTLRVVETVSKAGYNNSGSTSSAVAVKGVISTATAVAINGTPTVGTQSTTTGGTYSPSPTGRSYQWERCDTSGNSCVAISGATYNTYTPVAADAGKTLRVVETATKSLYVNGGSTSAASALVAKGTFVMNTKVAIFGYPKHGVTSTITQGSYTPTPTARTYQWLRCSGTTIASCVNISGATAKTYKPGSADIGKRLRVIETVSAAGYNNLSVTSDASTAVT